MCIRDRYQEAGLSLSTVHLGGDEVPRGVWMGSPKCQELMKEKGMTKAHDLSEYFITQMADVMQKNGLKFSGWQEVALGLSLIHIFDDNGKLNATFIRKDVIYKRRFATA